MTKSLNVLIAKAEDIDNLVKGMVLPTADVHMALFDKNGRATSFTYLPRDIVRLAALGEKRLIKANLSLSKRAGFVIEARSAGPYAKAYNNSAIGSSAKLKRTKKGWILIDYQRTKVYPTTAERIIYRAPIAMIIHIRDKATADLSEIAMN